MSNLFDYNPINVWNGLSFIFTNVTDDENTLITQIVLDSEGAQEATSRLDQSRYTREQYSAINSIIRDIYSGNTADIVTFLYGIIGEDYNIELFLNVEIGGFTKGYEILLNPPVLKFGSGGFADSLFLKHVEEPRTMTLSTGVILDVLDPSYKMPYMTLSWADGPLDPRCENPIYTDQISCEANGINEICLDYSGSEAMKAQYLGQNANDLSPAFTDTNRCLNFASGNGRGCYYQSGSNWVWSNANTTHGPNITEQECWESYNNSTYYVLHETGNTWNIDSYSWWPSAQTALEITGNIIYQSDGIYYLPTEFETMNELINTKTWNYDMFTNIGRQSRVFYIGHLLTQDTVVHKTKINLDNYIHDTLPPHGEVDTNSSKIDNPYGYTTYYDKTQIRWKRPDANSNNPLYGYPDRYRIYRSNSYYYGITSPTEYTMGIKRLVGDVLAVSIDDYNYFEEDEQDLRAEGLLGYQYAYYYVTAIYEDYGNTNRGLDKETFIDYFDDDLDWFDFHAVTGTETEIYEIDQPNADDNNQDWSEQFVGYFKARETGDYEFEMTSDDSSWLWIGTAGQTYADLKLTRDDQNFLIDLSGTHPAETDNGTISLIKDQYYPILIYYGNEGCNNCRYEHQLQFKPPAGQWQTSGVGYYFRSNDNSFPGNGQEVEGRFNTKTLRSYFR